MTTTTSPKHNPLAGLAEHGYRIGNIQGKTIPIQGNAEFALPSGANVSLIWTTSLSAYEVKNLDETLAALQSKKSELLDLAAMSLKKRIKGFLAEMPAIQITATQEIINGTLHQILSTGRYSLNALAEGQWPRDALQKQLELDAEIEREAAAQKALGQPVDYPSLFPVARRLKRKIIAYLGPTNSGKTWHALNRLADAGSGMYAGPLRLLALEGQEELFKRGCLASLITGEERQIIDGAKYTSCTVEMANLSQVVECAVIDEIQMLADEDRGSAWVRAFVGIPAKEVVVSGSTDAEGLLRKLAESLGETIEVIKLERHSPLEVMSDATSLNDIEEGTAIIAFSRSEVLRLRSALPAGVQAAVIYGSLSPEARREQAAKFRNGEANVLIATDCIAYGLNLPIRRVVFQTHQKSIARRSTPLPATLVKQIAGRAGRYGFFERGSVGALNPAALAYIKKQLDRPADMLKGPLMTRPSWAELLPLADACRDFSSLCEVLDLYIRNTRFNEKLYKIEDMDDMFNLADVADRYRNLTLEQRFSLACAPVSIDKSPALREAFIEACSAVNASREYKLKPPTWKGFTNDSHVLLSAEDGVRVYDLYVWLHWRFKDLFPHKDQAVAWRAEVNKFISESLKQHVVRRCTQCSAVLPAKLTHGICNDCYTSRF